MLMLSISQYVSSFISCVADKVPDVLGDLWAFQLAVIGILVSVLTLLFASLVGNVESYNQVKDREDINSQYLTSHLTNKKLIFKGLNNKIITLFVCLSLLFIYTFIAKYCKGDCLIFWLCFVDVLLTMALVVWMIILLVKVYHQYIKEAK